MCLGAIYWARPTKIYYANNRKDAADIGFDDEFIYTEIEIPLEKRKLPMIEILRQEAIPAFERWKSKGEKTVY